MKTSLKVDINGSFLTFLIFAHVPSVSPNIHILHFNTFFDQSKCQEVILEMQNLPNIVSLLLNSLFQFSIQMLAEFIHFQTSSQSKSIVKRQCYNFIAIKFIFQNFFALWLSYQDYLLQFRR